MEEGRGTSVEQMLKSAFVSPLAVGRELVGVINHGLSALLHNGSKQIACGQHGHAQLVVYTIVVCIVSFYKQHLHAALVKYGRSVLTNGLSPFHTFGMSFISLIQDVSNLTTSINFCAYTVARIGHGSQISSVAAFTSNKRTGEAVVYCTEALLVVVAVVTYDHTGTRVRIDEVLVLETSTNQTTVVTGSHTTDNFT